ncbi:hypothetical protein TCAL_11536 [Tigriopus californicus]|uniref:Uncharacterized protein n=1 Tax=Tigriopus californicus TaxID=6832 RepID=A0A553N977_TIGCA|nr:pyridoxal phosphate phosphatase PHOSPHO2-like [Tigriopus californicus]TRY62001.1 hypothetical protein TCAL_11536 [Tigriopus californicus]|eukprot:TCALIF_11536-PA protein Name:"Similar to phospho2 Probable phosphatase phospho2 (Xenopus tropicalis)" AED:0.02 eAED:0.02 QI:56/1/1/1/1/1/2/288/248
MNRPEKLLFVFDFDHTIVEKNTDVEIQVIPEKSGPVPSDWTREARQTGWTAFMGKVFEFHAQNSVQSEDYRTVLRAMSLVPGMVELIKAIKSDYQGQVVIISDSNSFFIQEILAHQGLDQLVDQVFTNHAEFDQEGCLRIRPFHEQTHCPFSPKNMCKGDILTQYLDEKRAQGIEFERVAYAGDGTNDFSAMLKLQKTDLAFPRQGDFAIGPYMEKVKHERGVQVQAQVIFWQTGLDILTSLKERVVL